MDDCKWCLILLMAAASVGTIVGIAYAVHSVKGVDIKVHTQSMAETKTVVTLAPPTTQNYLTKLSSVKFEDALGQGVYLPDHDVYDTQINGRQIFKDMPEECYQANELDQTSAIRETYSNNEAFYKSVSSYTGVSAGLVGMFLMGVTLGVKSNEMSTGESKVAGSSLYVYNYVKTKYIKKKCMNEQEFSFSFLEDLDRLELKVKEPWLATSWSGYESFLHKYGTHMVDRVYYGSSVRHSTFAKSHFKYSGRELTANACLNFLVDAVNVKPCTGVSSGEMKSSDSMTTSNKLDILGGVDDTRIKLRSIKSRFWLQRLLAEGRYLQAPVKYTYTAIWDLLREKFITDNRRKAIALNMMQYFTGFKDFGCTLISSGETKLRYFDYCKSKQQHLKPVLSCFLARQGCQDDNDCHIGGAGMASYCYGPSCYEYKDPPFGKKATEVTVRTLKEGSYDEGINESCSAGFFKAVCSKDKFLPTIIWEYDRPKHDKMAWLCFESKPEYDSSSRQIDNIPYFFLIALCTYSLTL